MEYNKIARKIMAIINFNIANIIIFTIIIN